MTMLSPTPLSGIRISSVVPAEVTGDDNKDYQLTNMDLALKLHYIRGVYFFSAEAVEGLTIYELKNPMFPWLALFYTSSGRIRRSETGRPFIKCNDGGVRIVEARCDMTVEELLSRNNNDVDSFLAHDQVLVHLVQVWGMSVGLSWAHVLGDAFSASTFINKWGQFMKGQVPSKSLHLPHSKKPEYPLSTHREPFSLRRVEPVGDCWLTPNNCKMETHSFHFTAKQLDNIVSNISGLVHPVKISQFEVIVAILWKSLSKIREDSGPIIVTICTRSISSNGGENENPSNKMAFSIARTDFYPAKGDLYELAVLVAEKQEEENALIEETVESDNGDYNVYGTNLTFVNLEEADIYGLELKEHKPIFAYYSIKSVGDEGAVLVLPGPGNGDDKRGGGRTVTVILQDNQLTKLKNELRKEWGIV
ncbi:hypothetical protein GH714_003449 [Hevea brasiliensis]|uniref:Uncharacterized protein n=1 Tax=Hevea brasiliensis TaxID=3981 RepID=A0A6A6LH22_HEVBR|nr:hypothetical protein GH714_003449 [Hevea brasiliensis]